MHRMLRLEPTPLLPGCRQRCCLFLGCAGGDRVRSTPRPLPAPSPRPGTPLLHSQPRAGSVGPVVTTNTLVTARHLLSQEARAGLLLPEPSVVGPLSCRSSGYPERAWQHPACSCLHCPWPSPLSLLPAQLEGEVGGQGG